MRWQKQGLIFRAEKQFPWMAHHASQPFAHRIENDLYRIYFTARDELNRSHVGWIEIDITRPYQVLRISDTPLLAPGAPGAFDDAGTMMSCLAQQHGKQFLFYTGWSPSKFCALSLVYRTGAWGGAGRPPTVRKIAWSDYGPLP